MTHRGVTLGTAVAGPRNVFESITRGSDPDAYDQVNLVFLPFEPASGYSAVQSICEHAWQVLNNLGFLGPAADPASDGVGMAAYAVNPVGVPAARAPSRSHK